MAGSIPEKSRNKKRRKRACSALLDFQKKLQNACGTFQTANEWYEYINELKDLIIQYTDLIPVPVQDRLNSTYQPITPQHRKKNLNPKR